MPEEREKQRELDAVLAALAHEARRHILVTVWFQGGTISAGEIAARFAHSWPTTSRHLRVLEQAELLEFVQHGRTRRYRLNEQRLGVVSEWLRWFREKPPAPERGPAEAAPAQTILRNIALAYPAVRERVAGGERVILVRSRPFLLFVEEPERWGMKVRLPHSREMALRLPFVTPVRYRLGQSDWVLAQFTPADEVPLELLWEWVNESYQASAPRGLLAEMPGPPASPAKPPRA